MAESITIRPIRSTDETDWHHLWTGCLEYYQTSVPEEVYQTTFRRLLSGDHPDQNGFIALAGEQAVDLVHYIYHAHNWRVDQVCYLQDLYTDPSVRGTGVGRKLIKAVYAQATRLPKRFRSVAKRFRLRA